MFGCLKLNAVPAGSALSGQTPSLQLPRVGEKCLGHLDIDDRLSRERIQGKAGDRVPHGLEGNRVPADHALTDIGVIGAIDRRTSLGCYNSNGILWKKVAAGAVGENGEEEDDAVSREARRALRELVDRKTFQVGGVIIFCGCGQVASGVGEPKAIESSRTADDEKMLGVGLERRGPAQASWLY